MSEQSPDHFVADGQQRIRATDEYLMKFDNQTGLFVVTPLGGSGAKSPPEGATTLLPDLIVKFH